MRVKKTMTQKMFKNKLVTQSQVFGCWQVIPSPQVSEILALSGFDYLIIDLEHGPISFETAENMVRAADLHNCAPLLRVPSKDEAIILRALEIGVKGIVVPQITTKEDAEYVVRSCYYHPRGTRGVSPFTRSAGYLPKCPKKTFKEKNDEIVVVLLVEGLEGISHLDDIISVPNIDAIYFGTYDLSQAAGYPGEVSHPEVIQYTKNAIQKVKEQNISVGMLAQSTDDIKLCMEMGINLIAYTADVALLKSTAENKVRIHQDLWKQYG